MWIRVGFAGRALIALWGAGCGRSEPSSLVGQPSVGSEREPVAAAGAGDEDENVAPPASAPTIDASPPVGATAPTDIDEPVGGDVTPGEGPNAAAELCALLEQDRTEQNLLALRRLGLELSGVRVEGRLGAPITTADGLFAPLDLDKVWLGPTFLEGSRTLVELDPAESAGLELPGRYILGFAPTAYPRRNPAGGLPSWESEVIIPSAERDSFSDLLRYEIRGEPLVAVVQVGTPDGEPARLLRVRTLAGEVPDFVAVQWDRAVFDADFPEPGARNYLATFASIHSLGPTDLSPAALLDFRPYDAEARAMAERALAAPVERDVVGLREAAQAYRTGWRIHRAPVVVATRISGIAHECCTGAGGTFFAHDVVRDFRGTSGGLRLMLGGHDYFSDEQCGDGFVFALRGLEEASPAEPGSSFACGASTTWPSLSSYLRVPEIQARLVDSEATRTNVERWLRSPEPRQLLRRAGDTRPPFGLGAHAVWSQPMSLEQALVAAPLIWVNVVGASAEDGARITVETSFSPGPSAHLPLQRFEIDAECLDPRLLRAGEWLVPLVVDEAADAKSSGDEDNAFLIPGVVLPNSRSVARIASSFRSAVSADQVLEVGL